MLSSYLSKIDGVEIYPVITLLIFFGVFLSIIVWTFKRDKEYLLKMSRLPIEPDNNLKTSSRKKNDAE
jgi:hypothetical protein